jgi:5-formyltetrahydrofolate cyclo-ligase
LDKNSFRVESLSRLKRIKSNRKYIKDKFVIKKLDEIIESLNPKSILFYAPLNLEVNLTQLMNKYRKKIDIYLPFIEEKSFKMVKYRLPLKKNSFNVLEPKNSYFKIKNVDMIIVPVVGVDGNFKRVGFGKGMYDRFYEKLKKKPVVIFVQRVKCFTNKKITDGYDISADFYITPK